jgi:hypothetical protein
MSTNPDNLLYTNTKKEKSYSRNTINKVFDGDEKAFQKTRYGWPFTFAFRNTKADPSSLPPSGDFGRSSVEYKLIAVPRHVGQTEDEIIEMMNPDDPALPRKTSIYSLPRIFANLSKKKLSGVPEQQLQFVSIP